MSWSLLPYAIPLIGGYKTISAMHPSTYSKYNEAPESALSVVVKEIAWRVLNAENRPGTRYQERIQDLIDGLPDSVGEKNVQAVIDSRIKVATIRDPSMPIHATGTDVDIGAAVGKLFIAVDPDAQSTAGAALPWICTHEICHLLEGDHVELPGMKAIASLAVAILTTSVLGWAVLPSIGAAVVANIVTHAAVSLRAEKRADDFANKHCTRYERLMAVEYFKRIERSRPEGVFSYPAKWIRSVLHPSEAARIAKIQASLLADLKLA